MKRKIIFATAIVVILSILGFIGITKKHEVDAAEQGKIKVMTSIYPLKEFAQIIGGDKVIVRSMVPDGAEPHDFEPKSKDIVHLNSSQLFLYNGLGMENWVDKVLAMIENKNLEVVNTSKNTNVILVDKDGEEVHDEHENHGDDDDHHDHGRQDPHIWLSLKEAKNQSKLIEEALIKIDPANASYYTNNYNNFAAKLDSLYDEYSKKFASLPNKNFVTGHAAFGYLCRDFGLNQVSVEDVFGEGEITPQHLKQISEYCKANNVKTIFMPDSTSEKVSQTLANEVGAKLVKISSLESQNGNKTYLQTMEDNLSTIYNNLK